MLPDLPGWDSLPAVTRHHNWAEMAGIAFLALLVIAEVVAYQYGHRKDDLTNQQQIATNQRHDKEMARLHLETAKAQEETEKLRTHNLELEAAVSPRILEQSQSAKTLKQWSKTQVYLQSVPDFEARRFLRFLSLMFEMAGWLPQFLPSDENIMDGIAVEYVAGPKRDPNNPANVDFDFNSSTRQAAEALVGELKKQQIDVNGHPIPPSVLEKHSNGVWPCGPGRCNCCKGWP